MSRHDLTADERNVAAAIKRAYPNTDDGAALRTAIELVTAGDVYRDLHGVLQHTPAASRRAPAVFPPPVGGDDDASKVARAMARESLLTGTIPPAHTPTSNIDPRVASAMQREEALRALGFDDREEAE
jgi:hypothetical protein